MTGTWLCLPVEHGNWNKSRARGGGEYEGGDIRADHPRRRIWNEKKRTLNTPRLKFLRWNNRAATGQSGKAIKESRQLNITLHSSVIGNTLRLSRQAVCLRLCCVFSLPTSTDLFSIQIASPPRHLLLHLHPLRLLSFYLSVHRQDFFLSSVFWIRLSFHGLCRISFFFKKPDAHTLCK